MVRCIWCGEEIEGSIRDHMAQKHVGTPQVAPAPAITPKNTTPPQQEISHDISHDISHAIANEIPKIIIPTLPVEKPKKRYLDAAEIITLLQNTNKQFSLNQVQGCPLKETE